MVYMILAPGFEEAEAIVPADLLRRAGVDTVLVSLNGGAVTGGRGFTIQTDLDLSQVDLEQAEMVVLPGGGVGVENLGKSQAVSQLLEEAARREIPLAALCAAPSLLARLGLLEGREATVYPTFQDRMAGAKVGHQTRVAADGPFITGQACGSSFEFGLKLVEVLRGEEAARQIDGQIYYSR